MQKYYGAVLKYKIKSNSSSLFKEEKTQGKPQTLLLKSTPKFNKILTYKYKKCDQAVYFSFLLLARLSFLFKPSML
jgi:hypothetical protein